MYEFFSRPASDLLWEEEDIPLTGVFQDIENCSYSQSSEICKKKMQIRYNLMTQKFLER